MNVDKVVDAGTKREDNAVARPCNPGRGEGGVKTDGENGKRIVLRNARVVVMGRGRSGSAL